MSSTQGSNEQTQPNQPTESTQQQQPEQQPKPSWKDKARISFSKMKQKIDSKIDESKNKDSRLSMNGLIKQARLSFEKWSLLQGDLKTFKPSGIVLLTSVKGSFGWGAEAGTGIVIYRLPPKNESNNNNNNENNESDEKKSSNNNDNNNNNNEWSAPCAIGTGGVSWGLQIGFSKIDHIIVLPSKHHVATFMSKGQLKLGGTAELAVVNMGGSAKGGINISDKEITNIHSWALDTKGLSIGIGVEGAILSVRNDCNENFYKNKVSIADIANGNVKMPIENEDYNKIIELINKHFVLKRKILPHGPHPHGPHPHPLNPLNPLLDPIVGPPPHHHHPPHLHHPHPHHPHPHGPPPPNDVIVSSYDEPKQSSNQQISNNNNDNNNNNNNDIVSNVEVNQNPQSDEQVEGMQENQTNQ